MQRLRRSLQPQLERDSSKASILHLPEEADTPKLERQRSSRLIRKLSRQYWKIVAAGCGLTTIIFVGFPRSVNIPLAATAPEMFSCPVPDYLPWNRRLPDGLDLSVHIVARGDVQMLQATLYSLKEACYPEHVQLPLHVSLSTEHAQEVLSAHDGFLWQHGHFQLGILRMDFGESTELESWASMWTEPKDNEVRLVIPEGMELSPLFYYWLVGTLGRYLGEGVTQIEREIFRDNVLGVSLSGVGLPEVAGRDVDEDEIEVLRNDRRAIFHTLPGSRGTAYFGWQWAAFRNFMMARADQPTLDAIEGESLLPRETRPRSWAGSLEMYLAEYMYGRGLAVLHPNLGDGAGFSRVGSKLRGLNGAWHSEDEPVSSDGEGLVILKRDGAKALNQPSVAQVPAYDLMMRKHPDLTHLRLLGYRFMQRMRAMPVRDEKLETLWGWIEEGPRSIDAKYLTYQPQFGMGNQLRALEAGLAIARLLGRTLVIPDYISDHGEGIWVRYDAIWEFGFLEELLGRDSVMLQADFNMLMEEGMVTPPSRVYVADMPIKQLKGSDAYFDMMGWGDLPKIPLPLHNETEAGWRELARLEEQVLAVSALFGMFQGAWSDESIPGDKYWHQMVKIHVSEETTWIHEFVLKTLNQFREKALKSKFNRRKERLGAPGSVGEMPFMCGHVRRQDFEASCARYDEEFRSGSARDWVADALGHGGICWVEKRDFRSNVDAIVRLAPTDLGIQPRFVFATSDDKDFLKAVKARHDIPVFALNDVVLPGEGGSPDSSVSTGGKVVSLEEARAALPAIDVAVCSEAELLLLNYFSTYSGLIKGKAKAHPGFNRALYWSNPPELSTRWMDFTRWLRGIFG